MSSIGIDSGLIYELACFGGAIVVGARRELFPLDLHAGGIDDAARGRGHFRADAFAGNQRDFMSHAASYRRRTLGLSKRGARSAVSPERRSGSLVQPFTSQD